MIYRRLGKSDLDVSAIAMGCWAIGGGYTWGDQDEKEAIDTVKAAIDAGINLFDTAEFYNDGQSERVLGKGLTGQRDRVLIASKIWIDNMTGDSVIKACEGSLKRLGTDVIDLYQIHWPNWAVPLDETLGAMEKLKKDGKIRFVGVSNFGVQDLTEALQHADIVTDQLAYSLFFRAIEYEILDTCRQADIGVIAYSPLAQGLLTDKFKQLENVDDERARIRLYSSQRGGTVHAEEGCEDLVVEALGQIRSICEQAGQPMANVALAWVLQQPGVCSVLAGARRPEQIIENARTADIQLDQDVLQRLAAVTDAIKAYVGPNADPWRTVSRIR
jgi:aryl-alcohol dehydrogenase-like predicted oxidoreductase